MLARLQGYSFQLVIQLACPVYISQLPSICVLLTDFKTFCWNKRGILPGTSWHFSNISSDISAPWAHESTSLDINKAKGTLTSNARCIFCDNVTCFGTNECCWDRSHLQGFLNCSSLLACKAPRVQLTICFKVHSHIVFPSYTLQLPSACVLLTAFKKLCWNKLGILTETSWHFSNISRDISAPWAHESTSLDVNKANGMLTSNATCIFCDDVTCFGTNTCCWDRSHLQECFNCSSLLACKAPRVQLSTCYPISFSCIHLTASLCVLLAAFKIFCWNKQGILPGTSWHFSNISSDISAPWAHESFSLDVNKANGMLTSNATCIFCDNVTCFGTNTCCWDRSHLQECFNCSSLLACKAPRVQLSTCYPISLSYIHLTASLCLCPAGCFQEIILKQAGNFHWNKLAFLRHIKRHICSVGA